jgi:predicted N-acetyltransferase YhbS
MAGLTLQDLTDGPLLDQVLDATYPTWGDGLTRTAYGQWNLAQTRTGWGRTHLQRVGLAEGGRVLASAKRYLFEVVVDGRTVSVLGIGAVFTPEAYRGRGLAAQLLDAMIADGRGRGCEAAVLFSEIGPSYYERLGFAAIPRQQFRIDVPRSRRGAPATLVRALEPTDLSGLAEIADRYAAGAPFGLRRSADQIEFGIVRRRLRAGLGPAGLRQVEVFVSEEGHRPVSFVVVTRGLEGVRLEDCGDRDPTGARIGAMLEVLAEREPSVADRSMLAWLPPGVMPQQVSLLESVPAAEVMMVRPLNGPSGVVQTSDHYWPSIDAF